MHRRAKRYYAVWSRQNGSKIVNRWEEVQPLIRGVSGVRHKGFYDEASALAWLEDIRARFAPQGFHKGPLPELAREVWRDNQISDQFAIAKDAGLI